MRKGFFYELKKNKILFIMFLPAIIFFLVFAYLPMSGLMVAFKDFNYSEGIFLSKWAGMDNFRFFILSGQLVNITKNTILYNLIFLAVNTILEVTTAIVLADLAGKYYKKMCQSITFLPYFVSWVVVSAFAYNFLNYEIGSVNSIIKALGHEPVDFYNTGWYWYIILPIASAWKNVGYGAVIYLAAVMGIDRACYESSDIDGANVFQRIVYITLPMLVPTIITLSLLSLGRILRGDFDMFYQLVGQSSLIFKDTDVIDTFVFRSLVKTSDIGMASAANFYQSVFCFVFIMLANKMIKMYNKDYALF